MDVSSAVWFPILTLVIGAMLTHFSDWRRSIRDSAEARTLRKEERMRALLSEQRQLMLELSVVVTEFARSVTLCHFEDEKNFQVTGQWGKALLGHELNIRVFEDARKLAFLSSRVLSSELRENLQQLNAAYAYLAVSKSEQLAWAGLQQFADQIQTVQQRLGTAIRSFDLVSFGSLQSMSANLGVSVEV